MARSNESEGRELVITRMFDAPRALVFKAWSAPEHLVRWWGPKDFAAPEASMDFRTGGTWRACMRSPEGKVYWAQGVYRQIDAPRRLAFTFTWDEMENQPAHETLVTVDFEDVGGKTRMTFRHAPFFDQDTLESHTDGWTTCFDKLEAYVGSLPR